MRRILILSVTCERPRPQLAIKQPRQQQQKVNKQRRQKMSNKTGHTIDQWKGHTKMEVLESADSHCVGTRPHLFWADIKKIYIKQTSYHYFPTSQ